MTRREKARAYNKARRSVSRNSEIPPLYSPRPRKGKCPQKIGMWGNISTDYRTPATHDSRYSQTVQNRNV